ncbi:MAG TPA: hypothetical protein VGJ94_06130 [Syntrophorhabdaceae bacterium]
MKKTLIVFLVVIIGMVFVTASFAKGTAKTKTVSGEVVSVDPASNTAVVKADQGDMTFAMASTKWKNYKSMEEMKPGDKVKITYTEKDGKMMATWVEKKSLTERMKEKVKGDEK